MFKRIGLILITLVALCGNSIAGTKAQIFEALLSSQRASGVTLSGGKVYFYTPGTTSLKTVYSDRNKTIAANPFTLDSNGQARLYGDGLYDVQVKNSTESVSLPLWEDVSLSDGSENLTWITEYTSLENAVSVIGSTKTTLYYGTDQAIVDNLTVPSTLELKQVNGAIITVPSSKTLTINGPFSATGQAFAGSGTVTFGVGAIPVVFSKWFGPVGDGVANDTTPLQKGLNAAFSGSADFYISAGKYLVTGLTIPGVTNAPTTDDRVKSIRIFGAGTGEPFVVNDYSKGTILISVTNAPILTDNTTAVAGQSNGTVEIDHIRFDGDSTTPVVLLNAFYGLSSFHNNMIFQRGTGDGFKMLYGATSHIYENYAMNGDYVTFPLGAARTGIGFNFAGATEAGLITLRKNSSRGWLTGFAVDGSVTQYSAKITESECSYTYNGIRVKKANKAIIADNYLEAGDGGTGIHNEGDYVDITNNYISEGYTIGIDDSYAAIGGSVKGTTIEKNLISMQAVAGIGIKVRSDALFGGYNKNVINNSISYTLGTAGTIGIQLLGADPRMNVTGNMFDPRGSWTGAGSTKIDDQTNGLMGFSTKQIGESEIPVLSRGAVVLHQYETYLTEADVTANVLTLPSVGSYFEINAGSAVTVNKIATGTDSTRLVYLRTINANMTFAQTSYIELSGSSSFASAGLLQILIKRIGADNYAYEVSRVAY